MNFGSEFEDPFLFSRQQILEDIMKGEEKKGDSLTKKHRTLSTDEAFLNYKNLNFNSNRISD